MHSIGSSLYLLVVHVGMIYTSSAMRAKATYKSIRYKVKHTFYAFLSLLIDAFLDDIRTRTLRIINSGLLVSKDSLATYYQY